MAWLAVDAGTSVVKAVIFANDGRELTVARKRTAVARAHPGWSEQDMDEVWSGVVAVARTAIEAVPYEVRGLAITAQGDGCWLVDAGGRPAGPAVLWNDARAASIVEAWRKAGVVDAAFHISGSVAYAGLPNAILAWLAAHAPERLERARWLLSANGWLFAQLTGRFAAELSDASNPFSRLGTHAYSDELLSLFGAERHAPFLPPIVTGRDALGALTGPAASRLGLHPGLPVFMAPYDIACTAYGAGAARAGEACIILGTTLCPEVLTASPDLPVTPMGTALALSDNLFLRAMPTLTGCEALEWAAQVLALDGIPALDRLASKSMSKARLPFFLPYLSPAGERSPFLAPEARGSFHGLSLTTRRPELARSVFEGLCFVIRECLQAAAGGSLPRVRVCGGGAASDFWCQDISDTLGVLVLRTRETENGARGAYLAALAAVGETGSIQEAVGKFVAEERSFLPDPEAHGRAALRFARFLELRDAARIEWRKAEIG